MPLVDMGMMRIRGVWTTNAAAFLLGAGMYSAFILIPQIAQLPKSTGFGFGASVVVSGLYLVPSTVGMMLMGILAGPLARRYGSRFALILGTAFTTAAFAVPAVSHGHAYDLLLCATLMGIGIGLAFAALGNLIVQAVPAEQTGVATGMNTVMRTLGGALGGQLAATLIAAHVAHGLPAETGFTESFVLATGFLLAAVVAATLVPTRSTRGHGARAGGRRPPRCARARLNRSGPPARSAPRARRPPRLGRHLAPRRGQLRRRPRPEPVVACSVERHHRSVEGAPER